ncbi:hypothetical protein PISMIDRAFT_672915 [Pisolithus microcarpus 441]|uniref:Uncharacterized protein n=1 Tax=Pisolithus microcarpus 441 TaxID=765257 RepID=A0A0D0A2R1_9AGAM|nr:hypothetical protein PISMIDRAFT_672915 [Pisolithus microcarpus 441]
MQLLPSVSLKNSLHVGRSRQHESVETGLGVQMCTANATAAIDTSSSDIAKDVPSPIRPCAGRCH